MPHLNEFWSEWKDKGLQMIAVSDEAKGKVEGSIDEHGIEYPVGLATGLGKQYGLRGYPSAYLIADGEIVWAGHPSGNDYANLLPDLLKKFPGKGSANNAKRKALIKKRVSSAKNYLRSREALDVLYGHVELKAVLDSGFYPEESKDYAKLKEDIEEVEAEKVGQYAEFQTEFDVALAQLREAEAMLAEAREMKEADKGESLSDEERARAIELCDLLQEKYAKICFGKLAKNIKRDLGKIK